MSRFGAAPSIRDAHGLRVVSPPKPPAAKPLPVPDVVIVTQFPGPDGYERTVASMLWGPDASYCGRCPLEDCTLHGSICAVPLVGIIGAEEAADLWIGDPVSPTDLRTRGA